MDLLEEYSWADEDCSLLTQQQVEYHKNVSFMVTGHSISYMVCPIKYTVLPYPNNISFVVH